jgi:hypothetical protein
LLDVGSQNLIKIPVLSLFSGNYLRPEKSFRFFFLHLSNTRRERTLLR